MKSFSFSLYFSWLVLCVPTAALSAGVDVYFDKAKGYVSQQEYKSAIIELKNVLQQEPRHAEARFLLGKAYIELGDGASAEKELRKALEFGVDAEKGMPLLGRAYLMQGKSREALAEVKLADSASVEARAKVLVVHGDAQLFQQSIEDAAKAYRSALQLVPDFSGALLGMAKLAINSNNNAESEKYVDQVLADHADDVDALILKGELLRRQAKHEEALDVFSRASKLRPQSPQALLGKAMAEVALQQFDVAEKDLAVILKLAPQHPMANYFQAVIYFQRHEPAKA
ncbi:MAG TPA: tetratricopeptide repeat protein, partial [Candidatus Tenderia electrophaga]|nr:tetratricopeptide repeat protein [Candidatus Tenderia electrophaga]